VNSPVRTCVGCRRQAAKSALVRLVWRQTVVVDPVQREPGRGAYLHPGADCLALAVRRRSLGRALRVGGIDPDVLRERWAAAATQPTA
jgi:predicted RNA-binding protein YlxR (DUF448 family)